MRKKADKIRKRLIDTAVREAIESGKTHTIAATVIRRAQYDSPDGWFRAASTQLQTILEMSVFDADALTSEFCTDRLIIS